jgi:hypothetical protein
MKLLVVGFFAIVVVFELISRSARAAEARVRRAKLTGRPKLDPVEICRSEVENASLPEVGFLDAWNSIAQVLQVDPGLLRPHDLLKDLDVGTWWFVNDFNYLESYLQTYAQSSEYREIGNLPDVFSAVKFACQTRERDVKAKAKKI